MAIGRIGYVVSQYPAVNHTFILREIVGLRAIGWEVEVVSVRGPDRLASEMSAEEAEELSRTRHILGNGWGSALWLAALAAIRHPLGAFRALGLSMSMAGWDVSRWLAAAGYWVEALVAGAWFEEHGVKNLHTHFASTVTLLAAKIYGFNYTMTIHGPDEFNDTRGFWMAQKVAAAQGVVAISNYAASQVMRACEPSHWAKVSVARLGVTPSAYQPLQRQNPEVSNLVMVGRLAPAKAQLILVEAASILKRRGYHQLHWQLIGGGPDRTEIERRISEKGLENTVELTGPLHHDLVKQIYRKTDLFVMASFAEGVPVVLMEAMAMGIPCIATWVMGIPELIHNGEDGLLVPPASAEDLAGAVERLCQDRELRERLASAGRTKIEKNYNLELNVARLSELLIRWADRR